MQWLTPLTAVYAALATIPLLLLLYFLKLKRHEQIVSSTFLWKRAVRDLQVNAPFQKLRYNILLLLQLLMLIAILLALAWPILSFSGGPGKKYVIMIDHSASMNAIDNSGSEKSSRLDIAKKQAKTFIESMRNKSVFSLKNNSDQTMIIAFDDRARVMCNFTTDKRQLISAIDSITPGHGKTYLSEAVLIADAFSQSSLDESEDTNAENSAELILFSDGQISDLQDIEAGGKKITYHSIGQSNDNAGITAMQALRSYENPEDIEVFASVYNFSEDELTCDLQLSVDNDIKAVREIKVPPVGQQGKIAVNFMLSDIQAGLLELCLLTKDSLTCDDAAWAVLPPPRKMSVLLVSNNNVALESALKACPLAKLDIKNPKEFESMDQIAMEIEQTYDIIILDNYVPESLPKGRYIVFGRAPDNIDVKMSEPIENQVIIDWMQNHPILKYVDLTNFFAAKCYPMKLPRDAEVLAEFNGTPAMSIIQRNGSTFLLIGFDIMETNWPFEPGFVLFCYNATSYLGMRVGLQEKNDLKVGEPIVLDGLEPATEAQITGPDNKTTKEIANPSGIIRFANTYNVGCYVLNINNQPSRYYAVNLLDPIESDIHVVNELSLSSNTIIAQSETISRANLPLWPFLVGIALILACIEWLIYNSKVRI